MREVLERAAGCREERIGTGDAVQRLPEGAESGWGEITMATGTCWTRRRGSYLALYSFPRLVKMGPSPGPQLMNYPDENRRVTGRRWGRLVCV